MSGRPAGLLSPERWKALEPLIDVAADLPRERRPAFLSEACRDDPDRRAELELLLGHYDRADTLLDHPAAERFASLLGEVAAPPPELVSGNYRIERKLGQGGMAAVYLAHDLRHDRKVALKILHPELTAAFRAELFLAEIRTMAQLRHPHILPLFDSGAADGVLFYVMPWVDGETLRQRIEREQRLPVDTVLRIVREVAGALESAHRQGVVHRDIKPENILLDDGGALVADFGIALAIRSASGRRPDQPGWIAGTPRYMSPEQMAGEGAIDGRADVYALGAVAFEMLAGRPPFMGERGALAPPSLHGIRSEIPLGTDAVLATALASAPRDRYQTAGELAGALERSLARTKEAEGDRPATRRWAVAGALAVVVAAAAFMADRSRLPRPEPTRPAPAAGRIGPHQTRNLGAYDLYMRGRDQALSRSYKTQKLAIQYFRQAIAADSDYAAAYAELAHMYALRYGGPDSARAAALKAIAKDSTLSDGWAELGFVYTVALHDVPSASAALSRALALDSLSPRVHGYLGGLYGLEERPAEALAEARRQVELDPLSVIARADLVGALINSGRNDEALEQLDRLRNVDPPLARTGLYEGNIYLAKGMWEEALEAMQDWTGWPGRALALAGRRAEAQRMLDQAIADYRKGEGSADDIAMIYDGLGDEDHAFAWLERGLDHNELSPYIMWPTFARLRADPRFDRVRRWLHNERK